jgi:hypothetical protein
MKNKISILVLIQLISSLLISIMPYSRTATVKAYSYDYSINVTEPSTVIKTIGDDHYSTSQKWSYTTITITPPVGRTVQRVVLIDSYNGVDTEIRDLPLASANKYTVGDISGTPLAIERKENINNGYFDWFRATDRPEIWMYDLDGIRHYRQLSGTFPSSQTSAKAIDLPISSTAPTDSDFDSVSTSTGNDTAWDNRSWNISSTYLQNSTGTIQFDLNDLTNVIPDLSINNKGVNFLDTSNILGFGSKVIDIPNKKLDFEFHVIFNSPYEVMSTNPRAIRYWNSWTLTLNSTVYKYHPMKVVAYYDGTATPTPGPSTPPPTGGGGAVECSDSPSTTATASSLNPGATGQISSSNGVFAVTQGIPTTEGLSTYVQGLNYLYQNTFTRYTGNCNFTVTVNKTYHLTWKEKVNDKCTTAGVPPVKTCVAQPDIEHQEDSPFTQDYIVQRPYSNWGVTQLSVWTIQNASVTNYALPGGSVSLSPNGYSTPTISYQANRKVDIPNFPATIDKGTETKDGGYTKPTPPTENFQSDAEAAVSKPTAWNDVLSFGSAIMGGSGVSDAPAPGTIAAPTQISSSVLSASNLTIPTTLANRANNATSGTINYQLAPGNIGGSGIGPFSVSGFSSVTVHTPVIDYASLPDINRPFDQSMTPVMSKPVLVLGRPFTILFNETGQHLNYPGYGNRDYGKYTASKRVTFPFGVYDSVGTYHPENTWLDYPVGTTSVSYTIPVWINEGNYHITTEAWAINTQNAGCQQNLNGNLTNYCATQGMDVNVVGRISDFRIWDIGDLRYQTVFRTAEGSTNHNGNAYYSGGRDKDKNNTTIQNQSNWENWILPVRPGSYPGQVATVPHNGYPILFDFKTIGNYWDIGEGIRLDPTFWFVPRSGGPREEVDLYYDASGASNKMIKVGSSADKQIYSRVYKLANPMRNIDSEELRSAANYEFNYILSSGQQTQTPWAKFYSSFLKRQVTIGTGYDIEVLPYKSRTLIGPTNIPSGVNSDVALRSVQHWYGEYNIPIAPHILPKDTNILDLANSYGGALDGHETEFKTGGYIVVNFGIYALKNNDQNTQILGYKSPNANMWAIEGQIASDQDYLGHTFTFQAGDIIMFESDFSVRNDFHGQGH